MTICYLGDHGIKTGTSPGVDNAGVLASLFAVAKPGDTFVLPTNGDLLNYGQLTFFDSRPPLIPNRCVLTGPNTSPEGAGVVRRYAVSDFREPMIDLSEEASVAENMTIYLHQDFNAGSPVGIVQAQDKFVISSRIRNISASVFGTGSRYHCWSIGLCLDGAASDGGISRGIREPRVENCEFWDYSYCGLYLRSLLGGEIRGITLTPMIGDPDLCDILLDGNSVVPSYHNQISGGQIGQKLIIGKAYYNMIIGRVGVPVFTDSMAVDNKIISPVFDGEPVFGPAGTGNVCELGDKNFTSNSQPQNNGVAYHVIISPGNIGPGGFSDRHVQLTGAKVGQTVNVTSAPPVVNCTMTAQIVETDAGIIHVQNTGSDILWLSKDIGVDLVIF